MPPSLPPELGQNRPRNPYFFYGHRKPTQNRPTVRGGFISNRRASIPKTRSDRPIASIQPRFDLRKWDPDDDGNLNRKPSLGRDPSENFFLAAKNLSPIARYIVDAFKKHKHWNPHLVEELNKLRRVTPKLVAEVLRFPYTDPRLSSKFFHWAGKQKGYKHDFACYNAFAYFLNRINLFRNADHMPELMNMQGKPPSEKQFEILIRMHADANRGLRVHYVYEKMKKFGVKPRVFLYNRILDALVKTDHLNLAMSVYEDFKNDGLVEESITFMILIKGLCKDGRIVEAMELLDLMRENLCKPDVFAYTAMVKVLVSKGNLDGSLKVWKEMREDGVEPDVMAYSTLVTALCKGNRVEEGYELFKEMKVRKLLIDRTIYGALIEAYVADGRIGSAFGLLKDLLDSGYRADLKIYNSLISGLCNAKLVDRASRLFQAAIKDGLQADFDTVYPILACYAESKRKKEFCQILDQMRKLKVPIVDDLPEFFSRFVANDNGVALALEVFESLKENSYLSVSTYNTVMGILLRSGEVEKALAFFNELVEDPDFTPDSSTFSVAVICYVEAGDLEQAGNWYNRMKEAGLVPSVDAYYSLAEGASKMGEIGAAVSLIRDCLANVDDGPTEFKYAIRVIHVCRTKDASKVVEIVKEMAEEGCTIGYVTKCAVIYGMCRYGSMEECRKVFSAMKGLRILREADAIELDEMALDQMKRVSADLLLSGIKFFGLENKLKAKGCSHLLTPGSGRRIRCRRYNWHALYGSDYPTWKSET